jgi:hypothetical protein
LNGLTTLFFKIQAPELRSGIFYLGWDGLPYL